MANQIEKRLNNLEGTMNPDAGDGDMIPFHDL
jgi:hypothetical protein